MFTLKNTLFAGLLLFAALSLRNPMSGGAAAEPSPLAIADKKQLLFDDALVASKTGFVTVLNPAVPHFENPVLAAEKAWEARRLATGGSVLEDEGVFKMWYTAQGGDGEWRLCYATSQDGIRWEKPELHLFDYDGNKNNNIVFAGTARSRYGGSSVVFRDPHDAPERRFKLVYGSTIRRDEDMAGLPEVVSYDYSDARWNKSRHFMSAAFSPDGLHWSGSSSLRMIDWYTDTQNVAFWDDALRKYVLFVRWNHERWNRAIGRSESADFEKFPKPSLVLTPDELDPVVTGLYNSTATKYPYAERAYFMFISAFFHAERGVGGGIDGTEVQLAMSRDGAYFRRPWRQAFVGVGQEGRFDASQIYMGTGMLRVADELWLYYTGYQPSHKQMEDPPPRTGAIGVARVRMDGFVSQDAPPTGGERVPGGVLTTVPLRFSGKHLEVNMNAGAGGWLKVELLDGHGQELPEFSGARCDLALGNSVRRRMTWGGKSDLSGLAGRVVRLKFIGRDVKLYAFQFPS